MSKDLNIHFNKFAGITYTYLIFRNADLYCLSVIDLDTEIWKPYINFNFLIFDRKRKIELKYSTLEQAPKRYRKQLSRLKNALIINEL